MLPEEKIYYSMEANTLYCLEDFAPIFPTWTNQQICSYVRVLLSQNKIKRVITTKGCAYFLRETR